MEELDLKKIWKTGEKSTTGLSQERIGEIISQRPQNVIASFVRSLNMELWINLCVLTGVAGALFYLGMWWRASGTLVLDVMFFLYYKSLIKRLSREFVDQNVVEYLNDMHLKICQFIRHFKIALLVVGLIGFCVGFVIGFTDHKVAPDMFVNMPPWKWGMVILTVAVSLGLAYVFFHQMYGKKAAKIKKMVESLKKEETD
ncbi:MAG: hypothetical protein OCD76_18550 [Reichenbachiella sp.]